MTVLQCIVACSAILRTRAGLPHQSSSCSRRDMTSRTACVAARFVKGGEVCLSRTAFHLSIQLCTTAAVLEQGNIVYSAQGESAIVDAVCPCSAPFRKPADFRTSFAVSRPCTWPQLGNPPAATKRQAIAQHGCILQEARTTRPHCESLLVCRSVSSWPAQARTGRRPVSSGLRGMLD